MAVELGAVLDPWMERDRKKLLPPEDIYEAKYTPNLCFGVVRFDTVDQTSWVNLTLVDFRVAVRRLQGLAYMRTGDLVLFCEEHREAVRAMSESTSWEQCKRVILESPLMGISVFESYVYSLHGFVLMLTAARHYGPTDHERAHSYANELDRFAASWAMYTKWDIPFHALEWLNSEARALRLEADRHGKCPNTVKVAELLGITEGTAWMNAEELILTHDFRDNRDAFRKRMERSLTRGVLKEGSDYRPRKDRATGYEYNTNSPEVRMLIEKARRSWDNT